MKYQLDLIINAPREAVVAAFLDPENLYEWQPDLVRFEPLGEGDPRALGAKNRQIHKMGKREIEMVETITRHDPPEFFATTYEAHKVWNLVENQLVDQGNDTTKWIVDVEFKCGGLVAIMAFFFPSMFKKQTMLFMERFKSYVETG